MFLVSYALDPANWSSDGFDFDEEDSLLEAIIPGFVRQLQRALRRGVLEGYRAEEASLMTVRGRLRVGEQLRKRFGAASPAEVTYDEFTEDIEENRLIKAALARLGNMRIRNQLVKRSLRRFDSALERVGLVRYDPRSVPVIRYTRLNEHYRPTVELARLILRSDSYELRHGALRGTSLLVDMNEVFEDFVVVALREALGVSERSFPQAARGRRLFLDSARKVSLEPDISWWKGGELRLRGRYQVQDPPGGRGGPLRPLPATRLRHSLRSSRGPAHLWLGRGGHYARRRACGEGPRGSQPEPGKPATTDPAEHGAPGEADRDSPSEHLTGSVERSRGTERLGST
jgi:hypothetical protein